MVSVIDFSKVKEEIVVKLRNADIFTTTQRGVTTYSDTGTFAGANTHTLANSPTSAKNVRSVTVAGSALTFGTDYTVNYGTGVISFTNAQTGAYTISYDSGSSDKIYADLPRTDLSLSSFPRLAVDIIGSNTEEIELGAGSNLTSVSFSVIAYDDNSDDIESILKSVWTFFIQNKGDLYYSEFVTKITNGPLMPFSGGRQKVMMKNTDYMSQFNLETS